jgi:hypothetical protein
VLTAQAAVDPEDEEIAEEEAAAEPEHGPAPEPPVIDVGGNVEQRGPAAAAPSSEEPGPARGDGSVEG